VTESVGNASLGSSPSEDFLIGDFTENTNIIYINDLRFGKTAACMMCIVLKTVLYTADLHIWHTFSQTQYNYENTFQQY